ncbi:U-box domain-containing protein 27-like [Typha latifolia]|uniref:U-box domain-containing protein 27-like n=1 Tax=Typha latifolia TaxID=4733 RepID=UPI003C30383C
MMGRKEDRLSQPLEVKVPSFFRCPISLDVMKSPVSLCTGVTYDRSSIQRWLESGNTTCPATMQPLPSTDLVPNLTLRSLIHLWSSAITLPHPSSGGGPDLLAKIRAAADPADQLRRLAAFFLSDDVDEFEKNNLVNAGGCAAAIAPLLKRPDLETAEATVRVFVAVLTSDCIEIGNRKIAAAAISSDLASSVSALVRILEHGSGLEPRIDAAILLEKVISMSDRKARSSIADSAELIREVIRLAGETDPRAVEPATAILALISGVRRAREEMVKLGVVAAATSVLASPATSPAAAEKAMRVMEAAAGCAEGRAAICEEEKAIKTVVRRMNKAGKEGAEAAVAVLWNVCHRHRDRRAADAAAAAEGGLTRLLLLMQSGCSPAARQMAADLLRIFKVNAKSCLGGYDTKTTHIMPF